MIDCTKTTNYFNEKLKMTKRTKNGLCEIKCGNFLTFYEDIDLYPYCPYCGCKMDLESESK